MSANEWVWDVVADRDGAIERPVTYVHIGFEKTGTTTIQAFMARNRGVFAERNLLYPSSVGSSNHLRLPAYAQHDDKMDDTRARYVDGASGLAEFRASVRHGFRDEVAAAGAQLRKVVLSNEHLSARLTHVSEVERLLGLIDECVGGPVRVVAYVREQVANMLSSYSTNLRHGRQHPPPTDLTSVNLDKYDYPGRIAPWVTALGEGNVSLRLFESAEFVRGDLLHDFTDVIDEPWPSDAKVPERKNQSFDATSMEFLRTFNASTDGILDGGRQPHFAGDSQPPWRATATDRS